MRKQLFLALFALPLFLFGQQRANYDLAARFSPKKLDKMIFSDEKPSIIVCLSMVTFLPKTIF